MQQKIILYKVFDTFNNYLLWKVLRKEKYKQLSQSHKVSYVK